MKIAVEFLPEKDTEWRKLVKFKEKLKELGKEGYKVTHATEWLVILQKEDD